MDQILQQSDVWLVTNWQAIQWMQNPTPINQLKNFEPWGCRNKIYEWGETACEEPNVCKVFSKAFQQHRYFYTCSECPEKYPWIRNEFGLADRN